MHLVSKFPQSGNNGKYFLLYKTQQGLSCPLLALQLGEYWFRIYRYVYDRSRPLAPILRQRLCSLMYDVYLTCIDDGEQVLHVLLELVLHIQGEQDQNTWNTIQDQN